MTDRRDKSGFTLIELLVVIAIIAILAAILFPVLTAAQKSAMKSRCVGNEKQILAAISLYAQDSGGKAPLGYDETGTSYNFQGGKFGGTWADRVLKYTKNKDVFICPAVPKSMYKDDASAKFFHWTTFPVHYGMNWRLCSGGGLIDQNPSLKPFSPVSQLKSAGIFAQSMVLEAVRRPSKTILICESQHMAWRILDNKGNYQTTFAGGGGSFVFDDTQAYYWMIRWLGSPYIPQGHGNGANVGCVDGHVQFVRATQPDLTSANGPGVVPPNSSIRTAGLTWWD